VALVAAESCAELVGARALALALPNIEAVPQASVREAAPEIDAKGLSELPTEEDAEKVSPVAEGLTLPLRGRVIETVEQPVLEEVPVDDEVPEGEMEEDWHTEPDNERVPG
jgi:hypothetical protein